jgi:putative SOS response-associated peptidase YedK
VCGRYSLSTPADQLIAELDLSDVAPGFAPHYNIAPTQQVAIVPNRAPRRLHLARWGLVPFFARDLSESARRINARVETAATKPGFRDSFSRKRCLVVADGFYEWRKVEGDNKRTPYYFHLGGRPFAFAGLWDVWRDAAGERVASCTILTTVGAGVVAPVHDRMAIILPPDRYADWLDPAALPPERVSALLASIPVPALERRRVSALVNAVANDLPGCTAPVDEPDPLAADENPG